jgi:hypothetical protein
VSPSSLPCPHASEARIIRVKRLCVDFAIRHLAVLARLHYVR